MCIFLNENEKKLKATYYLFNYKQTKASHYNFNVNKIFNCLTKLFHNHSDIKLNFCWFNLAWSRINNNTLLGDLSQIPISFLFIYPSVYMFLSLSLDFIMLSFYS